MLRLVGFFALVIVLHGLLLHVPVVGPLLASIGFFGYWAVAILASVLASRAANKLVEWRAFERRVRDLGAVDTPHNRGKLGLLQVAVGRYRAAEPNLQAAFDAQPDVPDWALGLGRVKAALGDQQAAGSYFARVVFEDAQFGYGEAFLGLADAALALGRADDALRALEDHDLRHGPNPRSAYQRGQCLRALGRKDEAREAFGQVFRLRSELPAFQRKGYAGLLLKAQLARLT
ncbi:MAG: tetratricopeptide repeat protein [Planctomycetota bacterium]|nr:tetratricopeptide repeat protein [Planctomycetota bacterium]